MKIIDTPTLKFIRRLKNWRRLCVERITLFIFTEALTISFIFICRDDFYF